LRKRASGLENADSVSFLGFLEEYETVLEYMRAAKVFASPSTREGFGITYAEAMAAGCIVIGAAHPESAASEVIGDAGYVVDPTVDAVSDALDKALSGVSPPTDPTEQARGFDWEAVTDQAESVYRRAVTDR
jgi:glycosyltransferase involved in cell wall biosynthesis